MAKRAARAAQTGFDIGGNGASVCPECSAPEYERHANGCPLAVGDGGVVDEADARAGADGVVLNGGGLNARLSWSSDAIGTWLFLMDGEQPLPLGVYGPDRAAERDRILTVLQRAATSGDHTRGE